jgi:hypothetical protein
MMQSESRQRFAMLATLTTIVPPSEHCNLVANLGVWILLAILATMARSENCASKDSDYCEVRLVGNVETLNCAKATTKS